MLRRGLDALYDATAWLAALFLVGTLAMVLTGIAGRFLQFYVPGTDAYGSMLTVPPRPKPVSTLPSALKRETAIR